MDTVFTIQSLDIYKRVSEEILNNLYGSNPAPIETIDESVITKAKDELKQIISSCNFDMVKVAELLQTQERDTERINWFLSVFNKKSTQLLYETLLHHNTMYGDTIINFDWYLKMIFGTSEFKTLRYPLLQLILSTINSNNEKKHTMFDVNKDILKKIIDVLQSADEE